VKGTVQIAKFAGIPVHLHWSFGFLIFLIGFVSRDLSLDWNKTVIFGLWMLTLFACVVLHEFGHALTAKRFGVTTKDIILLPIGGVARLNSLPDKPMHEFYIAIAGPMVNVAIAIVLGIGLMLFSPVSIIEAVTDIDIAFSTFYGFLSIIFIFNAIMVVFNMIPAFPMDGGRVLRSLLSIKVGRPKATRVAAFLGQTIAAVFFVYGIYKADFLLSLIGVFVFYTASSENKMVKLDTLLQEHLVSDLLRLQFVSFKMEDTMEQPFNELKRGLEKNFLVLDEDRKMQGVLHELFVIDAMKKKDLDGPVAEYISQRYELIAPNDNLKSVIERVQKEGYSILPVVEEDEIIGVIDINMLDNFIRLQQKMI